MPQAKPRPMSSGRSCIGSFRPSRPSVRASIWVATARTLRVTTWPSARRTPATVPSSLLTTSCTGVSTMRMPRAANRTRVASSRSVSWAKKVRSSVNCRNRNAWPMEAGPVARMPMGSSRTSQPWQYGQCTTPRPQCSARPGTSGSTSFRPVATRTRRALMLRPSAKVTVNRRSPSVARAAGSAEVTSPKTTRPPYWRTCSRPRRRSSGGGVPSRTMNPCMASAGALRGEPLSITTTERRERASISAPFSPAAPPPITTTSTVPSGSASLAYGEVVTAMASCLSSCTGPRRCGPSAHDAKWSCFIGIHCCL